MKARYTIKTERGCFKVFRQVTRFGFVQAQEVVASFFNEREAKEFKAQRDELENLKPWYKFW